METNTPVKLSFIETELRKFETEYEITEGSLFSLASAYQNLTVNGVDDKEGLKAVESARKELKKKRVEIKKVSEELRDSAVKFQKAVIAREKELVSYIQPQEERLMAIEDAVWQEKERLREEAEKKESDRIQNMLDQLREVNQEVDFHELKALTDEQFQELLKSATNTHNNWKIIQEQIRIAEEKKQQEEEQERKAEAEKLAAERKEVERMQTEMRAAQDKLAIEQAKVRKLLDDAEKEAKEIQAAKEAMRLETQRQAELEKAKKEAAEKAVIESQQKAERELKEAIEAARTLKELEEEKLLAGADKGKFEKIKTIIEKNFLDENAIIWLHFKSKKGKAAAIRVKELLKQANQICKENV